MYSVVLSQFLVLYTIDPWHQWRLNFKKIYLAAYVSKQRFFYINARRWMHKYCY